MDKRIIKTKRDILNAFLELRSKYPVDKIKIIDLCDLAIINKSTFYKYYPDIFALAEEVDNKIVQDIIADFAEIGNLFSDTESFLTGFHSAVSKHDSEILIVYHQKISSLVSKLEKELKKYYQVDSKSPEKSIMISFLIGGATHAMLEIDEYDKETVTSTLNQYISEFIKLQ